MQPEPMEGGTTVSETNSLQSQSPVQSRDGLSRTRTYNVRALFLSGLMSR